MSIKDEIQRIADAKADLKIAINNKGGNLSDERIGEYADAVNALNIEGADLRVRFIDYDGTVLKTEFLAEGGSPAPPQAPEHDGLIFIGWNCDYENPTGSLDVGAVYTTASGNAEFDVIMRPTTGYTVTFYPAVTSGTLSIDWGDGSEPVEVTYTQTISYTYVDYGKYTVTFSISEGGEWSPGQYFAGGSSSGNYWLIAFRLAGVTSINTRAFDYCYALRECVLCDGITTIGSYAFQYCRHLLAIVLPDSVTSVESYCFEYCYSLNHAVWGDGCASVQNYTFHDCQSLDSFAPPEGVTSIGEECFYNCYAMQLLHLPQTVTSLGRYVCENCYSLCSVEVPATLESTNSYLFYNCYSLEKFVWKSLVDVPERACYNTYNLKSIEIAEGVTTIGSNAFYGSCTLNSVELPESLTTINSSAFQNCYAITKLKLGSNLVTIGDSAFNNSYPLEELVLPESITTINSSAFQNCHPLREVTFPENLATIGNSTFQNCYGLRDIHCKRTEPPSLGGSSVFSNISQDCTIWVPKSENREILTAYKTATNWSSYADYMMEEED